MLPPPRMSPVDTKTKTRPQQSCLKCRERKVKCDRSIPCHACILRGLESECTYLTTPEDRAHINQAEVIEQLRREVAQLRRELNHESRKPSPVRSQSRNPAFSARAISSQGFGPRSGSGFGSVARVSDAGASVSTADISANGSWSGSSPSSSTTTMTNPMTVTSPGSNESDSGAVAQSSQAVYTTSMSLYEKQIAKWEVSPPAILRSNAMKDTLSHVDSMSGFVPTEIPPSTSLHGLSSYSIPLSDETLGISSVHMWTEDNAQNLAFNDRRAYTYDTNHDTGDPGLYMEEYSNVNGTSHAYPLPWGLRNHAVGQHVLPPPYPQPSYYPTSSINTFTHADPHPNLLLSNANPATQAFQDRCTARSQKTPPPPPNPPHAIASSWKGEEKQRLLETLLEIIGSCDEDCVAQVVQLVRASETPEEAVSGVCQVLGIGRDG